MALPVKGGTTRERQRTSDFNVLLIYRPRKDERLSWFSWLTYSGRFTHISDHSSAAGRAQNRESSLARDRRSSAVPRNQKQILQKPNKLYYESRPVQLC